jgi:hypothetical protein
VPAADELPADTSDHAVTAHVTGLASGTVYHYRLVAGNANGTNTDEPPRDVQLQTPGPLIADESVSEVASSSASFAASLVPFGHETSYYFQYSRSADFSDATAVPAAPGEAIGSGSEEVHVTRHVQNGLAPKTLYYFRVVGISELTVGVLTPVYGLPHTFTTQTTGALVLPDNRAWEMVTPPDKHGARLELAENAEHAVQAAATGQAVTYVATAPTESDPEGFANRAQIVSVRGTGGWETRDIETPQAGPSGVGGFGNAGQQYRQFSDDLSLAALQPFGAFDSALSLEASEQTAYLRTVYKNGIVTALCNASAESCYRPLVTGKAGFANVSPGTHFSTTGECPPNITTCGPLFRAGTSDFTHLAVSSRVALTQTPLVLTEEGALYEWSDGKLKLVSVASPGGGEASAVSGSLGNGTSRGQATRVISSDGHRVVWTGGDGHLYVSDTAGAMTSVVQIDAGAVGTTPVYQTANSELTRLWFTDEGDLYQYDVGETGGLQRLTENAAVQGTVLGASDDGSWLYFVADGVIPDAGGGVVGAPNVYSRHGGVTSFVATLSQNDSPDWAPQFQVEEETSRVSPNGRWLAFMSERALTGYDNRDAGSGQSDEEVFVYNGESGRLVCASCNPTGARPSGVEFAGKGASKEPSLVFGSENIWHPGQWLAASVPGWVLGGYQSRYLSDTGRVFFDSSDALVPSDVNGTQDVYEWEPTGVTGCSSATVGFSTSSQGCVGLISSGIGGQEAAFLDASESGGDVFFMTANALLPQDFDSSLDVYDAHECTSGSPCLQAAGTAPAACQSLDACRAAVTPQSELFGAPASALFSGPGNAAASTPALAKRKSAAQIRTEKLAKGLGVCRRKRDRHRRTACEREARRLYGARKATRSTKAKRGSR